MNNIPAYSATLAGDDRLSTEGLASALRVVATHGREAFAKQATALAAAAKTEGAGSTIAERKAFVAEHGPTAFADLGREPGMLADCAEVWEEFEDVLRVALSLRGIHSLDFGFLAGRQNVLATAAHRDDLRAAQALSA